MLNRYSIDVSFLNDDEIVDLKDQLNKFAFDIYDGQKEKTLDVFLEDKYNFKECFSLPPQCTVNQIG